MIKRITKTENGFTIIETMIAVSLFIVIIMIGMGALLNANLLHNKAQKMRSIMDSMSFVVEDISRSLRTGYHYQCFEKGQSLSPGSLGDPHSCAYGWALAFEADTGNSAINTDQWAYYINDGKVFKSTDGMANSIQLTPDEVVINDISGFSVLGAPSPAADDKQQPFVTIRLVGTITYKDTVTPFSLQTSVSHRLIDIDQP